MCKWLRKSKSQVEKRGYERVPSVKKSNLMSYQMKCEQNAWKFYYLALLLSLTLSRSLSLFWQLKLGFWTFHVLLIYSLCLSEPDRACFTSSIWMKYFTGQWFTFWLYDADMRLTVENIAAIFPELKWLKLNSTVTVNKCQQCIFQYKIYLFFNFLWYH